MYAQMSGLAELPDLIATRFSSIRTVAETGSTNADLLAEAVGGAAEGLVLATDHQTAGRGRQSRNWHDDPGNAMLASVLLRPRRDLAPVMPLLAGVAVVDAVATLIDDPSSGGPSTTDGRSGAGLKWPNDVLVPSLGERKLAGILAESTTAGQSKSSDPDHGDDSIVVVVGTGLNLRWGRPPPDEISRRAATLAELLGRDVERDVMLDRYLRCLELWLGRIEAQGTGVLLDRYRRYCLTIGRRLRFATAATEHVGIATDVSATGTLMMDTDDHGTVELHAGDAHHLP